jgi:GWxTD domain-containing protein
LNPEKAIEFLSFIEQDSVVDELLNADEEDYPKVLQNYWKKFDPTPETSFNEIMFEYYSRIDYAMNEFNSITNNNGAKTDRGMVYIRYGQPDNIDRTSTSQGEVIEIWTYSNSQRKFTFIDKIGTGNFTLTEN